MSSTATDDSEDEEWPQPPLELDEEPEFVRELFGDDRQQDSATDRGDSE